VSQAKEAGAINQSKSRHSGKAELQAPSDQKEAATILQAMDREIDFYRKRSGQVFFFSLLVEVLILAGREKILLPERWPLLQPIVYSILFIAVAAIGIALGAEYRGRIRILKDSRLDLLEKLSYQHIYPTEIDQGLSEIQVLYVVLIFMSSGGLMLVWLNALGIKENPSFGFWATFTIFMAAGIAGMLYSIYRVARWLRRKSA